MIKDFSMIPVTTFSVLNLLVSYVGVFLFLFLLVNIVRGQFTNCYQLILECMHAYHSYNKESQISRDYPFRNNLVDDTVQSLMHFK